MGDYKKSLKIPILNSLDYSFCDLEELKAATDLIRSQNNDSSLASSIYIL